MQLASFLALDPTAFVWILTMVALAVIAADFSVAAVQRAVDASAQQTMFTGRIA